MVEAVPQIQWGGTRNTAAAYATLTTHIKHTHVDLSTFQFLTSTFLPSMIFPVIAFRATLASSAFMKVTKPKPFDPRSLNMISASIISPNPCNVEKFKEYIWWSQTETTGMKCPTQGYKKRKVAEDVVGGTCFIFSGADAKICVIVSGVQRRPHWCGWIKFSDLCFNAALSPSLSQKIFLG